MRKKKAFTLIEVLAVMLISSLLLGLGGLSYGFSKEYRINNLEREFLNEVYKLLNRARDLCIESEISGNIDLNSNKKTMIFYLKEKKEIQINIPTEIEYVYNPNRINIKFNGDIDSCTLKWQGKQSGNEYKITVQVGINTIRIYKNGKIEEG